MNQRLYVVSAHPLASAMLIRVLASDSTLRAYLYPKPYASPAQLPCDAEAIVVLDSSTLLEDVPSACRVLRVRARGLRCLVLLHPERSGDDDILRLMYAGIEGCLPLNERIEEELCKAVHLLREGELCFPASAMRKFVRHSNSLLDQINAPPRLTARESQVYHLVARKTPNKDIAKVLGISERTVKYHVSNMLGRLGLERREQIFDETLSVAGATHAPGAIDAPIPRPN